MLARLSLNQPPRILNIPFTFLTLLPPDAVIVNKLATQQIGVHVEIPEFNQKYQALIITATRSTLNILRQARDID